MIYYACIWLVLGIAIAAVVIGTCWFWILQGVLLLLVLSSLCCRSGCRYFLMTVVLIDVGMNYFYLRHELLTQWVLPASWIQHPVSVEGRVISIPAVTPHAQQFLFRDSKGHHLFRLSWYNTHQAVRYADQWRFTVSLKPPSSLYNPGGFDYAQWLILNGIQATGYVKAYPRAVLVKRHALHDVTQWRQALQNAIQKNLMHSDSVGLIVALTIGSHNLIQAEQWPIFQRTATNHLIAISGLHIGFAAGFGLILVGFLWRRCERLILFAPVQYAQAVAAILFAVLYGMLAGFSVPTQRAVFMVVIVMSVVLAQEEVYLWRRLVLAFCVVVLHDPFTLYSASLWMSFGSVASIAYVCGGRFKAYSKMTQWWRLQLALFVGLTPLTLFYYHQVSIVGIVANMIAVPWVGFVIVPLCLLAALLSIIAPAVSNLLFIVAGKCIAPLWCYLQWLSDLSCAVWVHVISADWILFFALVAAFLILLPRAIPGRWFGVFLALPLFFYRPAGPAAGEVWLTTLAVGQGLSVVLRTAHHVLLYDAGPKSYSGFDAGASVVVPYLQYMGISALDMMMISHGDNDHIGGAASVLQAIPTQQVLSSVPAKLGARAAYCYKGQSWRWDGVLFQVLWPLKGQPYADNNSSCVLRVKIGAEHILLTGDIQAVTEQSLLQQDASSLPATVLVAPHHGSNSSSIEPFVAAVHPSDVIFATGAYNRFHFPAPRVVSRYQNIRAKLYNTATDGAVTVQINSNGIEKVQTGRE